MSLGSALLATKLETGPNTAYLDTFGRCLSLEKQEARGMEMGETQGNATREVAARRQG